MYFYTQGIYLKIQGFIFIQNVRIPLKQADSQTLGGGIRISTQVVVGALTSRPLIAMFYFGGQVFTESAKGGGRVDDCWLFKSSRLQTLTAGTLVNFLNFPDAP